MWAFFMSIFGDRLKQLREEKNMSVRELSEASGISSRNINYWEAGRYTPCSFESYEQLADVLGVTPEFFLHSDYQKALEATLIAQRDNILSLHREISLLKQKINNNA